MSINDEYYKNHYRTVTDTGMIGVISRLIHIIMENQRVKGFKKIKTLKNLRTLEVGAGMGQHKRYVKNYSEYIETDIRPENLPEGKFKQISIDCSNLPFPENSFDRLIATCLLVHLNNPEKALLEFKRVVKTGGVITLYVACEPGIFLRVMQQLTTRRIQKNTYTNPKYRHYQDHVSNYPAIKVFINHIFSGCKVIRFKRYPFHFMSWNFNLFAVVTIQL
jgi:ubiquinone/menaquinone biosynthesis C-methylase UbiE